MRNEHAFHLSLLLLTLGQGCAGKIENSSATGPSCLGAELDGQCIGATKSKLCGGETCVSGASCSAIHIVKPSDDIQAIAAAASPGECLALTAGSFASVDVTSGVSLLGVGKGATSILGVQVQSGSGTSLLRGMSVTKFGVFVTNDSNATIDQLEISTTTPSDAANRAGAIFVADGASVDVRDSTILSSAGYGLLATDASSVTLARTVISQTDESGFWVQCTAQCDCVTPTTVSLDNVLLNSTAGLTLIAANATFETLSLKNTASGLGIFSGGATAQGLVVASCSTVVGNNIEHTNGFGTGLFVDQSSVTITGGTKKKPTLSISQQAVGGIVIRDLDPSRNQQVTLEGFELSDNALVGVSATFTSLDVRLSHGTIQGTQSVSIVGSTGGTVEVGDGLVWADGSRLILDDIDISSSARVNLVLDGDAGSGSTVANVTVNDSGTAGNALVQATGTLPPGLADLSPDVHPTERVIELWNANNAPSPP